MKAPDEVLALEGPRTAVDEPGGPGTVAQENSRLWGAPRIRVFDRQARRQVPGHGRFGGEQSDAASAELVALCVQQAIIDDLEKVKAGKEAIDSMEAASSSQREKIAVCKGGGGLLPCRDVGHGRGAAPHRRGRGQGEGGLPLPTSTAFDSHDSLCPFRCGSSRSVSGSGRGRGRRQRNRQRRRRQLCSCVNAFLQPPRRCTDPILALKDLVTAQRQAAAIEAERKRKREASERESRKPARLPAPGASWFTDVGPRM